MRLPKVKKSKTRGSRKSAHAPAPTSFAEALVTNTPAPKAPAPSEESYAADNAEIAEVMYQAATKRAEIAEAMYQAAIARDEAAQARERVAAEHLAAVETREQAVAERAAAAEALELAAESRAESLETIEQAAAERIAAIEAREQAAADRIAAIEAREQAVADRAEAILLREQAAAERAAAVEAREQVAAERDAIANARDRAATERDQIANERDKAIAQREASVAPRPAMVAVGPGPAADSETGDSALERARLEAELQRAHLDSLTGVFRREMGRLALRNEIERARRADGKFVIAFIDVDGLKGVNDRDGHAAGDRILRTLAATMRANLRSYDPIVRFGGDEFICGISSIDQEEVQHRIGVIDQSLRNATGVGITAGLAALTSNETLDELTAKADAALIEAKRNRGE